MTVTNHSKLLSMKLKIAKRLEGKLNILKVLGEHKPNNRTVGLVFE